MTREPAMTRPATVVLNIAIVSIKPLPTGRSSLHSPPNTQTFDFMPNKSLAFII